MRGLQILFIVFITLSAGGLHAKPLSEGDCVRGKLSRLLQRVAEPYRNDDGSIRWSRFLFKPVDGNEDKAILGGLLTEYRPPENPRWYNGLSPAFWIHWTNHKIRPESSGHVYFPSPFSAIYHQIDRPVRALTKAKLGQERGLTLWVMTPLMIPLTMPISDASDWMWDKALAWKHRKATQEQDREYDALIARDYRLDEIRRQLKEGKIDRTRARELARLQLGIYHDFYTYLSGDFEKDRPEERRRKLLEHPLFVDIATLATQGIPKNMPGAQHLPGFQENPSAETVDRLIGIREGLLVLWQMVPDIVHGISTPDVAKSSMELQQQIARLKSDPFAAFLFEGLKKKELTEAQVIYRLQEDIGWQARFATEEVLGIRRPMTIDDIRVESVQEMRREQPSTH